jgi:NAD(P)-dependent dehydrogenase (short-subunit alcohol dehydrogenase family)
MNKTIVITGASSGIGAACVKQAANYNLNIIAIARSEDKLLNLQSKYKNVEIIIADLSSPNDWQKIADSIKSPIDYLLHNAACLDTPQSFENLQLEDFQRNIKVNVEPILFLTQKLLPQLKAGNSKARMLSVSTGAAKHALLGLSHYCVSKAAALMATEMLKVELGKHDVLANNYFPGSVDTSMQKTLRSSTDDVFAHATEFGKLKDQGLLNKPEEVAKHILEIFIKSSDADFVNNEWLKT